MRIDGYAERTPAWLVQAVRDGSAYPYPGASIIPPVVIPSPPHVDPTDSKQEQAAFIAKSYRTAFRARTGRPSYAMTRGSIENYRYYNSLVTAAKLMHQFKASPLTWAYWSMGIWEEWKGIGKPAPVNWIFSAARIDQRMSQYREEAGDGPARASSTFMHRALIKRYNEFLTDAQTIGCKDATEKHFPGSTYETLVLKSRKEQKSKQREVEARLRNGEWVW